ncbi:MAG TPA: membrane protein insertion efficiency factor YidD [Lentisphaeria bacterium]|nr:MAG: membrane protein insertion efficiency factor YidD [Lentisphaerae bacterium GWF2_50_93]HCE43778.1 membrane protein insertion efficiency factor YidD [Lentisphaeria bacterium]
MIKYLKPVNILLGLVWLYRKAVSPWMLPCCRFTPTCSEYAFEAIKRHGMFSGPLLSAWRILRCNPFCRGGHDPVPRSLNFSNCRDDHAEREIKKVSR